MAKYLPKHGEEMDGGDIERMQREQHPHNKNGKIHIKPSHRGELHEELGVPMGKRIPERKLEKAEHSRSKKERRQAVFAENMGHRKRE